MIVVRYLTPPPQVISINDACILNFTLFGASNSDRCFLLKVNVGGLGEPYSKKIAKALKWIKVQEKKIPLLYSRLEFGANWEAATQTIAQKMNI